MKSYCLYTALTVLQLAVCGTAIGQVKEEFNNLLSLIPAELTVNKTDNSMLLSDASAGDGQYFTITVSRSTLSLKKIEKSFPEVWYLLRLDGKEAEQHSFIKN